MIYNTAPNAHRSRWLACLHLYTYVQTGLSQLSSTYTSVIRIRYTGVMDGGKDCIFCLSTLVEWINTFSCLKISFN